MIKYGEGVEVMGVGCKGERGGVDWVGVSRGGGGGGAFVVVSTRARGVRSISILCGGEVV